MWGAEKCRTLRLCTVVGLREFGGRLLRPLPRFCTLVFGLQCSAQACGLCCKLWPSAIGTC